MQFLAGPCDNIPLRDQICDDLGHSARALSVSRGSEVGPEVQKARTSICALLAAL